MCGCLRGGADGGLRASEKEGHGLSEEGGYCGPLLSGSRCFELLLSAIRGTVRTVNYWKLWAFVDVLYPMIERQTNKETILSSALSPDPLEDDYMGLVWKVR